MRMMKEDVWQELKPYLCEELKSTAYLKRQTLKEDVLLTY